MCILILLAINIEVHFCLPVHVDNFQIYHIDSFLQENLIW